MAATGERIREAAWDARGKVKKAASRENEKLAQVSMSELNQLKSTTDVAKFINPNIVSVSKHIFGKLTLGNNKAKQKRPLENTAAYRFQLSGNSLGFQLRSFKGKEFDLIINRIARTVHPFMPYGMIR